MSLLQDIIYKTNYKGDEDPQSPDNILLYERVYGKENENIYKYNKIIIDNVTDTNNVNNTYKELTALSNKTININKDEKIKNVIKNYKITIDIDNKKSNPIKLLETTLEFGKEDGIVTSYDNGIDSKKKIDYDSSSANPINLKTFGNGIATNYDIEIEKIDERTGNKIVEKKSNTIDYSNDRESVSGIIKSYKKNNNEFEFINQTDTIYKEVDNEQKAIDYSNEIIGRTTENVEDIFGDRAELNEKSTSDFANESIKNKYNLKEYYNTYFDDFANNMQQEGMGFFNNMVNHASGLPSSLLKIDIKHLGLDILRQINPFAADALSDISALSFYAPTELLNYAISSDNAIVKTIREFLPGNISKTIGDLIKEQLRKKRNNKEIINILHEYDYKSEKKYSNSSYNLSLLERYQKDINEEKLLANNLEGNIRNYGNNLYQLLIRYKYSSNIKEAKDNDIKEAIKKYNKNIPIEKPSIDKGNIDSNYKYIKPSYEDEINITSNYEEELDKYATKKVTGDIADKSKIKISSSKYQKSDSCLYNGIATYANWTIVIEQPENSEVPLPSYRGSSNELPILGYTLSGDENSLVYKSFKGDSGESSETFDYICGRAFPKELTLDLYDSFFNDLQKWREDYIKYIFGVKEKYKKKGNSNEYLDTLVNPTIQPIDKQYIKITIYMELPTFQIYNKKSYACIPKFDSIEHKSSAERKENNHKEIKFSIIGFESENLNKFSEYYKEIEEIYNKKEKK